MTQPEPNWAALREQFPALRNVAAYLNTATYGQLSRASVEAVQRHFERRDTHASADFLAWFDDIDALRAKIARLIQASSGSDIAFCTTASAGLAWLMNGIEWRPGDRILSLAGEFPNNTYAPEIRARDGVTFLECEWPDLDAQLTQGPVRLVLLSSVNYSSGLKPDLTGLAARVRAAGGLMYVDGTQSVGALQFDVSRWQPDMLSVNAYKWLNAPNGAAFAYISPRLREQMRPTTVGWRSDEGWRSVDQLNHGAPVFSGAAERYEGGMLDFPSLYALDASVDLVLGAGPERIEARVLDLAGKCGEVLREFGGEIAYSGSQILAARFDAVDASALARELKAHGVHVSARHGRLRVSTHFYNNEADLDVLRDGLRSGLAAQRA